VRRPARMPLEQLEPYLLSVSEPATPTSPPPQYLWAELFGTDHPVEIEVGFGKGLFLVTSAQSHPEINYVGVEIERKYQLYAATRMAKRSLRNVRLACADARDFLRERVPVGSVAAVHVYFPDPWWKKRHHKRRVFTEDFARQCARVLRPGGRLHVATDVEEYFGIISELLAGLREFRLLPRPEEQEPRHNLDYLTNYERKARLKGTMVHRAIYERVVLPEPGATSGEATAAGD
jgi:tRNA (guanine-N7-)-methyltransferase